MTFPMADDAWVAAARPTAANIPRPFDDGKGEARSAEVVELEQRLVERAQDGDRDAFGDLYRIHRPGVFRLTRFYLGAGAEDAVSETFVRAWAALPRYRRTGAPFASWLHAIARHVAMDELRKSGRSEPRDELPDAGVEPMTAERLALSQALECLPTEQRQVIELKFLVGLTNPEVARALNSTPGAVNSRQWRALAALRELLGGET